MKKKKWLLPLCIAAALLLCILFHMASGFTISAGRCLIADNGSCFLVQENRPVKLNYKGDIHFQTGDKLLVLHQNVYAESYPEQTRAYFILKTGSGSADDVPQAAKDVLTEVGMLSKITGVRITLQDRARTYYDSTLAEMVETSNPEQIDRLLTLRDGLNPKETSRPMDFPRYVITFAYESGFTSTWLLDSAGVTTGDHLGIGNRWLDSEEPYKTVAALFDSLS